MTTLTPPKPISQGRRKIFSLLLNCDEYLVLSKLSTELGMSRGATLRVGIRNLLHTTTTGSTKAPLPEVDKFWSVFRQGGHHDYDR